MWDIFLLFLNNTVPNSFFLTSSFFFFYFSAQPQLLFHTDHGGLCVNISQLQVEDNEEKDKGLQLKIEKDGFSDETWRWHHGKVS